MTTRATGETYEAYAVQFEPELYRVARAIDPEFGGAQGCKVFMPPSCTSDLGGKVSFEATWDPEDTQTSYVVACSTWPQQISYNNGSALGMSNTSFKSLRGPLLLSYRQEFTVNPSQSALTVTRNALLSMMGSRGRALKPFHTANLTVPHDYEKLAQSCGACLLLADQDCFHDTEMTYWHRMQAVWDVGVLSRLIYEAQIASSEF